MEFPRWQDIRYQGIAEAQSLKPDAQLRLFGRPEIAGRRQLGVALSCGQQCQEAVTARIEVIF